MRYPRAHLAAGSSPDVPGRRSRRGNETVTIGSWKLTVHPGEPMEDCVRTLLEASSSAILLLSPDSIILGWNRSAETVSGWMADQVLGLDFVERFIPKDAHASFQTTLAQVTAGKEVRGLEIPLQARTGSQTMFSWNISRVLGTHGCLIGLMAIGTALVPDTQKGEELRLAHARILSKSPTGPQHHTLSKRELEVLVLLARGQSIRHIAQSLTLSRKTVSTYRARLLDKLQLTNTAELIRYALDHHLIE